MFGALLHLPEVRAIAMNAAELHREMTVFDGLIVANFSVAYYVLAPQDRMRPAVQAIPLEPAKDISITLLANLITLTPGTLSLDVSPDRKYLFIHNIGVTDIEKSRKEIKETFERRILEVTR